MQNFIIFVSKWAAIALLATLTAYGCGKAYDKELAREYAQCLAWQEQGYGVKCKDPFKGAK